MGQDYIPLLELLELRFLPKTFRMGNGKGNLCQQQMYHCNPWPRSFMVSICTEFSLLSHKTKIYFHFKCHLSEAREILFPIDESSTKYFQFSAWQIKTDCFFMPIGSRP